MLKIEKVATVVNTRPAPCVLAYKPKGAQAAKGRRVKALRHVLRPGRNDLGGGLGQLSKEVWDHCRNDRSIQMQLAAGVITEHTAEQPVPRKFDAGKSTLDMGVQEAIAHISDLGSREDFSLLKEIHIADERPEVRAAVEARLQELSN